MASQNAGMDLNAFHLSSKQPFPNLAFLPDRRSRRLGIFQIR
jgi:hypothetical protein